MAGVGEQTGVPPGSPAYEDGFRSFPVSLPFAPFGAMSEHQRAFYEGWIAAAYTVFGRAEPAQAKATADFGVQHGA